MKLEVGKKYRTRTGEIVKITGYNPDEEEEYPYSSGEEVYKENGRYFTHLEHEDDLIEEIKENKMKLEVGKYYKNREGKVVMIINYYEGRPFPCFDGEDSYLKTGRYLNCEKSAYDLIEEVVPVPVYRVKVEQTDMRDFTRSMEGEKGKVYTEFNILTDDCEKFIDMGGWSYYATQVDAGYIDPITGEFVMNESKNESKKLKLEVGKTYRDGYGELHRIVNNKPNSCYPEHVYWSDGRSYTAEGFWQMDKEPHKYNLIEEVEVEAETCKTTTKEGQPKMKYYRTTEKNTETYFPIGTIVTLDYDDDTDQPQYKDVNTGDTNYLVTDRLEEINVKTVKTVISPASKLVKILEDSGYEVVSGGNWWKRDTGMYFVSSMFLFCGKEPDEEYTWLPEWLEEKVVFDSVVNTFNARQFIVDFMKKKRELSHEAYLYQRDIDEIENEWSDEECEKVAGKILAQVEINFTSSCCPFCIKFSGGCDNCSYGKRHGVCSNDYSDFGKYIKRGAYTKSWPELLDFVDNYPGARK